MKKVKEMEIIIDNYEVVFGPEEGQNNITQEMRDFWKKEHENILNILKDRGYVKEGDSVSTDMDAIKALVERGVSFEEGIEIAQILGEQYEVTAFVFDTEYDDFYHEDPCLSIFVKTK